VRELEKSAFDTIDRIKNAKHIDDVSGILKKTAATFGFNCFLITGVPLPGETLAQHVVLSGWSPEWMERYNKNDYVHVDPVANQIRRSARPFRWSDVSYDTRKQHRGHVVMMEAKDCGMRDGYTVPIYGYDGYQACVTMGGDPVAVSDRELCALHLISLVGFSVARDLAAPRVSKAAFNLPTLTEREAEILKWCSIGKTAWEIGSILSISERTVESHLKSISFKLNVGNRTHAVALALRSGIIN
jgi:LuxR family transcriptional regulator, quorum-sensing system regulator BjaR1